MVAVAIPLDRSIGGGDRDVPGCRYGSHLVRIATQWLSPGFDGLLCFLLHGAAVEDEGVFAVVDRENLATDAAVGGSQGWGLGFECACVYCHGGWQELIVDGH